MGIGKNKSSAATFAAVLFLAALPCWAVADHHSGIWKILRDGHFSGPTDSDARVEPIGSLFSGGKHYRIMSYAYEENPKKRQAPQAQYRLLVFAQTKMGQSYLGSYLTDGEVRPYISGRTVFFPYKALKPGLSKNISFENGPPPVTHVGGGDSEFRR